MQKDERKAAAPAAEPPAERWRMPRPLRDFLATHEVHIPHRVPHSQRAQRAAAVVLVAIVVLGGWWWIIPRGDAVLEAQYHEGLFNAIAVDLRIINSGTVAISPLRIDIVITDLSTNASVGFASVNATAAPHATLDVPAVNFKGDQITTNYGISITLTFDAGGGRTTKSIDFRTEEPFMNLYFRQRVV